MSDYDLIGERKFTLALSPTLSEQIRTAALSMSMQGPHERRMMSTISRSYGWMNEQIKAREVR